MPANTAKQRRFMGAELARKRAGQRTKTGMSERQLEEFAMMHGEHEEEMKKKKHRKGKMEMKSHMPSGGKMKGPWGDIGALRQEESTRAGGFKDGSAVKTAGKFGSA